jgi:hypothetical protein
MKIYIVFGQTGEYSDRVEWPVKAFQDEEKAKRLVELATTEALNLHQQSEDNRYNDKKPPYNKFDPFFRTDYTGTTYFYQDVELEEPF